MLYLNHNFKGNLCPFCEGKSCCFRPDNQELQEAFDTVYEVQLLEINLLVLFLMFAENIDVVFSTNISRQAFPTGVTRDTGLILNTGDSSFASFWCKWEVSLPKYPTNSAKSQLTMYNKSNRLIMGRGRIYSDKRENCRTMAQPSHQLFFNIARFYINEKS